MTKCKECGNELSAELIKCPVCETPVPRKIPFIAWLIFAVFIVLIWMSLQKPNPDAELSDIPESIESMAV